MSFRVARRMDGIERTLIRRIFDAAPPGSINLGLGQPDLPTPPRISLAGIDGIVTGKTGYTATAGDPAVRAAIAARYPGVASGASSVVVTIGSQEAVFVSAMTLVDQAVHPTLNQVEKDPECDLDYVPNVARRMKVDVLLSNSLGFGGHNVCICLSRFAG